MKVKEQSEKVGLKFKHSENEDHGIWSHHFMANRGGNNGNSHRLYFGGGSKITADGDYSHEIKRCLLLGRKAMTNLDSRDITLPTKVHLVKAMVFSSGHVWLWELDYKESWALKNQCFWTVLLKTLESPLDCKEIQPLHPKGDQSWIFTGRTEPETPILWPPDVKNWLIGKDPDAGKDWSGEKGTTEDEMVGWHHWLNGHEFESTLGVGNGQGGLACCSPRGCRVGHNWATEVNCIQRLISFLFSFASFIWNGVREE